MREKTSGIKIHIGVFLIIKEAAPNQSKCKKVLVDGGQSGKKFAGSIKELIQAKVEVVKRNQLHKFKVLPNRWIVERSFPWFEDYRLLWKNCERNIENTLQDMKMAFISLSLNRYQISYYNKKQF